MPSIKPADLTPIVTSVPELSLTSKNGPIKSPGVTVPLEGTNVQVRLVAADWLTDAYKTLTGTMTIEESFDNGTTWQTSASTPFTGGTVTPPQFGQPGGLLPDLSTSLSAKDNHQARLRIELNQDAKLGFDITVS